MIMLLVLPLSAWAQAKDLRRQANLKIVVDSVQHYIVTGQKTKAETLLGKMISYGYARQDTEIIVMGKVGLINTHIIDPVYIDSVLDDMVPMARALGQPRFMSEYYIDKAVVAAFYEDYVTQILYVDSALALATQAKDSLNMAYSYTELSRAYANIGEYATALDMARKATAYFSRDKRYIYLEAYSIRGEGEGLMKLGKLDSAIQRMKIAEAKFLEVGDPIQTAMTWGSLGKAHTLKKDFPAAETYFQKAGKTFWEDRPLYSDIGSAFIKLWYAEYWLAIGQTETALRTAIEAYEIADSLHVGQERMLSLELILKAATAEYPIAQRYLDTYLKASKESFKTAKARAVLDFEKKYKANEQEKRILKLDRDVQDERLRAEQTRFWIFVFTTFVILAGLLATVIGMRTRNRNRQKMMELNRKALQLQINPHFFFNVLNSINQYISENNQQQARYYLAKFAKLMRLSLETSRFDEVELGQEIELSEAYLMLEQLRRDRFDVRIEVPDNLKDLKVPPMLLQPLVENAVVHAFPDDMPFRGEIKLKAEREEGFLVLTISDNGVGMNRAAKVVEEGKTSLAMDILQQRIRLHGNRKGDITFGALHPAQTPYPGTLITLKLPIG